MTLAQTLFSFNGRINRAKYWTIHLLILAAFFELGFRKGTDGPNHFGADPLEDS